jgi:hypothetical protein
MLKEILKALPEGILIISKDLKEIFYANPALK